MIVFDLSNDSKIKISSTLSVKVSEHFSYKLYGSITLSDVLEQIDLNPTDYDYIDIEDIIGEIDYEGDYEELLETTLDSKSRNFLSLFLYKMNEQLSSNYNEGVIEGESESFYDLIYFDGEINDESLYKLNELNDLTGGLQSIIDNEEWTYIEDVFYIIHFQTKL